MHKVIPMSQINLPIPQLDPGNLIHQLIPPCLHNLNRRVHLRVQNPQENKPLIRNQVQGDSSNLRIPHRIILQRKLTIREHELRVILLCALNPPWRVDDQHIELAHLRNKQFPVEIPHVAVEKRSWCPRIT